MSRSDQAAGLEPWSWPIASRTISECSTSPSGASREAADERLLRYPDDASVMAHIGRFGWKTPRIDGAMGDDELIEAVGASYAAIVSKLPGKDRPART